MHQITVPTKETGTSRSENAAGLSAKGEIRIENGSREIEADERCHKVSGGWSEGKVKQQRLQQEYPDLGKQTPRMVDVEEVRLGTREQRGRERERRCGRGKEHHQQQQQEQRCLLSWANVWEREVYPGAQSTSLEEEMSYTVYGVPFTNSQNTGTEIKACLKSNTQRAEEGSVTDAFGR
ncbi:predicted protein [Histoplasma capsulatum G186AR]|uniref:Uncharacterized protein n=1 Tax=Ajellomyces capsulatus (strain G186AR / H82 / ATCC MYA-2454 / RMSCC 2432) TaxID=447093 RepID=C0NJD5_AJECG|nr:uncharacterized protein HCBG_03265 [Histoplasma capsulatum G186AR]EEH07976.1 predicted protein [Histoplasma capsulatum G186AR]